MNLFIPGILERSDTFACKPGVITICLKGISKRNIFFIQLDGMLSALFILPVITTVTSEPEMEQTRRTENNLQNISASGYPVKSRVLTNLQPAKL